MGGGGLGGGAFLRGSCRVGSAGGQGVPVPFIWVHTPPLPPPTSKYSLLLAKRGPLPDNSALLLHLPWLQYPRLPTFRPQLRGCLLEDTSLGIQLGQVLATHP